MEPTAPQEEIDHLVQAATPTPPFKFTGWRHWAPYLIGVIFFASAVAFGYYRATFSTPATETNTSISGALTCDNPTSQATNLPKAYYAKIIGTEGQDNPSYIYCVYSVDSDGKNKKLLFKTGGTDDPTETFTFLKKKAQIVLAQAHLLKVYDLTSGQTSTLFGLPSPYTVTSITPSPDETKLALEIGPNDESYPGAIATLDLTTKTFKVLQIIYPKGMAPGVPTISFATPTKLFLNPYSAGDDITLLSTNWDGSATVKTDYPWDGSPSSDGSLYVYVDASAGKPVCLPHVGPLSDTTLTWVNVAKGESNIIESDASQNFSLVRFSPDNKQFIYTATKYQSVPGCTVDKVVTTLYDTATKKGTVIASEADQVKLWYAGNVIAEIGSTVATITRPVGLEELIINGQVIETASSGGATYVIIGTR